MKRLKIKYEEICTRKNVYTAFINASYRKRNRRAVKKIWRNLEFYVDEILNILKTKSYIPSPYIEKKLYEGSTHKERIIYKPKFYPDQIIHHCLMNIIEPYMHKRMYTYSCASIKNRGIHYGVKHIKRTLGKDIKGTKYCFKLDIRKFYPSVDKVILKQKFKDFIKDKDILDLINRIIDSHDKGLPIGNYTSQWFANFYLLDLDMDIMNELRPNHYSRYADDMVIFSSNKRKIHYIRDYVERHLIEKENLILKDNWQIFKTDSRPLDYLGYKFYKKNSKIKCNKETSNKLFTTLRGSIFLRITRRTRKIYKKTTPTFHDASTIMSYRGWYIHSNSRLFEKYYILPFIDFKQMKEVIRKWQRQYLQKTQQKNMRLSVN